MENRRNIHPIYRKHAGLVRLLLLGILFYGCSDDPGITDPDTGNKEKAELFICLHDSASNIRNTGDYPDGNENKVYSLEALVFNSDGTLDAYQSIPRQVIVSNDPDIPNRFREINEITGVRITRGAKNIYIVANTPDNSLSGITSRDQFIQNARDILGRQGIFDHPASGYQPGDDIRLVTWDTNNGGAVGGVNMEAYATNLTMCGYLENITIDNNHDNYYLGYTGNGGYPPGVSTGGRPNANNKFELERLAARVAVKNIAFDLPAQLQFETSPTSTYEAWINSFFVIGARYESCILSPYSHNLGWTPNPATGFNYASGCGSTVYELFKSNLKLVASPLHSNSPLLYEDLLTPRYNIEQSAKPLWFYVFENNAGSNLPVYLVVDVEFRYLNSTNQRVATHYYYPVEVYIASGQSNSEIVRNNQYRLSITIKELSSYYSAVPASGASFMQDTRIMDVEIEKGTNLFPWTGSKYIQNE